MLASFVSALVLRALKWTYVLRARESISWGHGFHATMIGGVTNYLFPVRIGELVRLFVAKKIAGVSYASSTAATIIDRSSSLLVIVFVLSFYPVSGYRVFQGDTDYCGCSSRWASSRSRRSAAAPSSRGGSRARCASCSSPFGLGEAALARIAASRPVAFVTRTLTFCSVLELRLSIVAQVFVLSAVVLLCDALVSYWLLASFGLSIGLGQALIAAGLFNLAFALPSAPGQVGTAEMLPVIVFSYGLGLASSTVASAALLWHFLAALVIVALGTWSCARLGFARPWNVAALRRQLERAPGFD